MSSEPYVPLVCFGRFARKRKIASRPSYTPAMTPRPGTDHTASSAKSPRCASASLRAKASKIRRTIASFSAAGTALFPPGDEPVDVAALRVGERRGRDEPSHLVGVVVLDRGFEMLALRCRLAQLTAQPAEEAHGGLVGHPPQAIRRSVFRGLVSRFGGGRLGVVLRLRLLVGEAVRAQTVREARHPVCPAAFVARLGGLA